MRKEIIDDVLESYEEIQKKLIASGNTYCCVIKIIYECRPVKMCSNAYGSYVACFRIQRGTINNTAKLRSLFSCVVYGSCVLLCC